MRRGSVALRIIRSSVLGIGTVLFFSVRCRFLTSNVGFPAGRHPEVLQKSLFYFFWKLTSSDRVAKLHSCAKGNYTSLLTSEDSQHRIALLHPELG